MCLLDLFFSSVTKPALANIQNSSFVLFAKLSKLVCELQVIETMKTINISEILNINKERQTFATFPMVILLLCLSLSVDFPVKQDQLISPS